jgi:uncharacterized protein (TIGR02996 family)
MQTLSEEALRARAALIRGVCETPEDDTVRLVYADWLEEHDQPEHAEFIRVQIGRARKEQQLTAAGVKNVRSEPGKREQELFQRIHFDWGFGDGAISTYPQLCAVQWFDAGTSGTSGTNGITGYVRRGFVERVSCRFRVFHGGKCGVCSTCDPYGDGVVADPACPYTGLAGKIFAAHPVTEVECPDKIPSGMPYDDLRLETDGAAWYFDPVIPEQPDDLPKELVPYFTGGKKHMVESLRHSPERRWTDWWMFESDEIGKKALSDALVRYHREKIDLPNEEWVRV